jgi:hypothetical protein
MAPTFLLWALYFLVARHHVAFAITAVLSMLLKEEVGLIVAAIGVYAWLVLHRRRLGTATAIGALSWVAICFLVIIPAFNGGAPSLFISRYGDAIGHLHALPGLWFAGTPTWPVPDFTRTYVLEMLAGTGFLALLSPFELALALPILAINGLSGSSWQHGGGGHYSAEVVPGLLFGAIATARRISEAGWRYVKLVPGIGALLVSLVVLGGATVQTVRHGLLPPAARFTTAWAESNGRLASLQPLLDLIPPAAAVPATSNVCPHVSQRERAYVFPVLEDAEYVLVDVAGTSDPLYIDDVPPEVNSLRASSSFRLLQALQGFLLFERTANTRSSVGASETLPDAFLDFARPTSAVVRTATPVAASFDGRFDLVGVRTVPVPEVNFIVRRASPTITIRASGPLDRAYRITTFRVGADGLARIHDDGNATQLWHPSYRWRAGETLVLRYPPMTYVSGERLGLGAQVGVEADASRLRVTSATHRVIDGGRVVLLDRLP